MKKSFLLLATLFAGLSSWAIEKDSDGYYLIGSVDDWNAFAAIVAEINDANARMIADVDLGESQAKIGHPNENPAYFFKGVFDGQGHTLTVHYVTDASNKTNMSSPFPNISEATIKNIHFDGTIENATACQPAVIADVRYGTSTVENIWSSVTLNSTKRDWVEASGLVGCVDGYKNGHLIMKDCMVSGTITASGGYNGCFVGYVNNGGSATVENCLSIATFNYSSTSGFMGQNNNCYVKQFPSSIPEKMRMNDEQLADGTITAALQGDRTEEVWVQDETAGTPMLKVFVKGVVPIYIKGDVNGDGSVDIADINATISIILQESSASDFLGDPDANGDNDIDINDINLMISIILGLYKEEQIKYVDLGLPSGILWATHNVGASKPEDYGKYFAWGDTIGYAKDIEHSFDWANYVLCNGEEGTLKRYCTNNRYGTVDGKTVLEEMDDVATSLWGEGWRMPTYTEARELYNSAYTTWEWVTINDVPGMKIISKANGNSIFLPAAGHRNGLKTESNNVNGYYWTSTLHSLDNYARVMAFGSAGFDWDYFYRFTGRVIRPVYVKSK